MSEATRILVVEDEGVVAKDLQVRLRKLGYDVPVTVQTGEEAVLAARQHRPELILMDVRLKGAMDGIQASEKIMQEFRTPVIFLTAYADDGTLGRAKLTEPYGFILKPFNERELHTAIQVALHKHQGELALRRSERWLAGTLRSIGDGLIAVDADSKILFMNEVAAQLTGWSEKDAVGRELETIYRITEPRSRPTIQPDHVDEDAKGTVREGTLLSRSRLQLPIEDTSAPIRDESGAVAGAVIVFRDISKRREAEAAQRANESQLRGLANSMSHLAWMAEPNGNIFWYNDRWYAYTGTTAEQMQLRGWEGLHDPTIFPEVVRRWNESLASGKAFDMEHPLRSATGSYRWFLTRVTPVTDADGKVIRWFGTNTDVHDAREIREQLERANANLAQFAYSASHDLREPLRNVAIFSHLLNHEYGEVLAGTGAEYLGYIAEGASRMEGLVSDLLAFAETGTALDPTAPEVNSTAILDEVLANLKPLIDESGAQVTCGELPVLKIRPAHLAQLFQNLVENAIKYRSTRAPVIEISAQPSLTECVFSVRDNGIGIAPEYLDVVFGLFKRLHTRREYAGSGLGLALCRNIAGIYGGRIWVESKVDEGSVFQFSIPRY